MELKTTGPSGCSSCPPTSTCFSSKSPLGAEFSKFSKEQQEHLEGMRMRITMADLCFRSGNLSEAKIHREAVWKMYQNALGIFDGREAQMFETFGNMIAKHCANVDSLNFLNEPAVEAIVKSNVQKANNANTQELLLRAKEEILGIFDRSVANLKGDEQKLERFYSDFESWIADAKPEVLEFIIEG